VSQARAKNKTLAAVLAAIGGSMGLHRFYLYGLGDTVAWLFPIPSALGWWGVERMRDLGQDDMLSWALIPLLGATLAVGCLMAVIYALTPAERWNARHNPQLPQDDPAGRSHGLTVVVLVFAMLAGTIAFMGSLSFGVQKVFEYQIESARASGPA
jgi:hypothetical protein